MISDPLSMNGSTLAWILLGGPILVHVSHVDTFWPE